MVPQYWSLGLHLQTDIPLRLPAKKAASTCTGTLQIRHDPDCLRPPIPDAALTVPPAFDGAPAILWRPHSTHVATLDFQRGDDLLRFVLDRSQGRIRYAANGLLDDATIATFIEGVVLGCYLRLQGDNLLHGAALSWNARHFALCGPSAAGKSTLAEMCVQHGATPWSEDILRQHPDSTHFFGDARQRRLSSESTHHLAGKNMLGENTRQIFEESDKQFFAAGLTAQEAPQTARALDTIVLLGPRHRGDTLHHHRLQGAEAIAALMQMQFPSWLRLPMFQQQVFHFASQQVAHTHVMLLQLPDGLQHIEKAAKDLLSLLDAASTPTRDEPDPLP